MPSPAAKILCYDHPVMPDEREPTLEEIEAVMAAAQDADGNDIYLEKWRASLTEEQRTRNQERLRAFIASARVVHPE
jgi:hypothetical protein